MKTIFAAIRLKVFASGAVGTNTNALTYRVSVTTRKPGWNGSNGVLEVIMT
jgi:hypothetical protein